MVPLVLAPLKYTNAYTRLYEKVKQNVYLKYILIPFTMILRWHLKR